MSDDNPGGQSKMNVLLSAILFTVLTAAALYMLSLGPMADSVSAWRRNPGFFYPLMGGSAAVFAIFAIMGFRRYFSK